MKAKTSHLDCHSSDDIVCPFCGHRQEDAWEYGEGDYECNNCGNLFQLSVFTIVSYTTSPPDFDAWEVGDEIGGKE